MIKSRTSGLKYMIVDTMSLSRQALGLSHNKTRAQVAAIKGAFEESQLNRMRVSLIAKASNRDEAEVESFINEFADVEYRDGSDDGRDLGAMSLRDCITLHALIRAFNPKTCVETGTSAGASATVILRDLMRRGEGHLYSIDIEGPRADHYGELIPAALRERWELRLQRQEPLLPSLLQELQIVDLFLHDSRHTHRHMRWEYEQAWPHIRPGGCLASHDVVVTTAFDDFRGAHTVEIAHAGVVGNLGFLVKHSA